MKKASYKKKWATYIQSYPEGGTIKPPKIPVNPALDPALFKPGFKSKTQGTLDEVLPSLFSREETLNYLKSSTDKKTRALLSANEAIVDGASIIAPSGIVAGIPKAKKVQQSLKILPKPTSLDKSKHKLAINSLMHKGMDSYEQEVRSGFAVEGTPLEKKDLLKDFSVFMPRGYLDKIDISQAKNRLAKGPKFMSSLPFSASNKSIKSHTQMLSSVGTYDAKMGAGRSVQLLDKDKNNFIYGISDDYFIKEYGNSLPKDYKGTVEEARKLITDRLRQKGLQDTYLTKPASFRSKELMFKDAQVNKEGGIIKSMQQGGMIQQEFPKGMVPINIEKDELLVSPEGKIIRSYTMQLPHAEGKEKEPPQNFTLAPVGHIVIPKKWSAAYKTGDSTTRKSILANLAQQDATKEGKMSFGGFIKDIGKGYLNNALSPIGYQPFKSKDFESQGLGQFSTSMSALSSSLAPVVAGAAFGPLGSAGAQGVQGVGNMLEQPQYPQPMYKKGGRVPMYELGTFGVGEDPKQKLLDYYTQTLPPTATPEQRTQMLGQFNGYLAQSSPEGLEKVNQFLMKKDDLVGAGYRKLGNTTAAPGTNLQTGYSDPRLNVGSTAPIYNNPTAYKHDYGMIGPVNQPSPSGGSRLNNPNTQDLLGVGLSALSSAVPPLVDIFTRGRKPEKVDYGQIPFTPTSSKEAELALSKEFASQRNALRKYATSGRSYYAGLAGATDNQSSRMAQLKERYANFDASRRDQLAGLNKELYIRTVQDNMANKARTDDIRQNDYNQLGQVLPSALRDYRQGRENQQMMDLYAASYGDTPAMREYFRKWGRR